MGFETKGFRNLSFSNLVSDWGNWLYGKLVVWDNVSMTCLIMFKLVGFLDDSSSSLYFFWIFILITSQFFSYKKEKEKQMLDFTLQAFVNPMSVYIEESNRQRHEKL